MPMFQFNVGGIGIEPELDQICTEHYQCENCPMLNGQVMAINQVQVVCENSRIFGNKSGSK